MFFVMILTQNIENTKYLRNSSRSGNSETLVKRARCPLKDAIFHNSWIGILCTFFDPPFWRALFFAGHVGDAVFILMSSFHYHWFPDASRTLWHAFQNRSVELWLFISNLLDKLPKGYRYLNRGIRRMIFHCMRILSTCFQNGVVRERLKGGLMYGLLVGERGSLYKNTWIIESCYQ